MRRENAYENTITMLGIIGFDSGSTKFNFNPNVYYSLPIFFNDIKSSNPQSTISNLKITTVNGSFSDKKIDSKITSIEALTNIDFDIEIGLKFIDIAIHRDVNGIPNLPYKIRSSTYYTIDDSEVKPAISIDTVFTYNTGDYYVVMGDTKGVYIKVQLKKGQILKIFGYLLSLNVDTGVRGDCLLFNNHQTNYSTNITY
jgi:hypothetical protein